MDYSEGLRYGYPLDENSFVIDCGCFKGLFSRTIMEMYGVRKIIAFEPIEKFHKQCCDNLAEFPRVQLHNSAIGGRERFQRFGVKGDMTGAFTGSDEEESNWVTDIGEWLRENYFDGANLIKINIEGMEFELLERLIELNKADVFENIQVQFHSCADNAEKRREIIRKKLLETHKLTYDFPFVWENFQRK